MVRDLLPCPRRQVEVDIPSHPRQIGTFGALGWMELSTLPWIVGLGIEGVTRLTTDSRS